MPNVRALFKCHDSLYSSHGMRALQRYKCMCPCVGVCVNDVVFVTTARLSDEYGELMHHNQPAFQIRASLQR